MKTGMVFKDNEFWIFLQIDKKSKVFYYLRNDGAVGSFDAYPNDELVSHWENAKCRLV